jgi:hypothetical protein
MDANSSLFPLAYAVVDAENDSNWLWFLQHLRHVLQAHALPVLLDNSLVFLSDRQKGLIEGVSRLFPDSPHAYCLRHLDDNMRKAGYKHPELKRLLWKAARAMTEAEFNQCLQDMRAINSACVDWLLSTTAPEHWADLYFQGHRYGHLTSNIAEAFNSKLLEAREMPILAMLEEIRHQLMGWYAERRFSERNTIGGIVSGIATKIQKLINERARRYRYVQSTEDLYEIRSQETLSEYIVNLALQTCSCREWQFKVHATQTMLI